MPGDHTGQTTTGYRWPFGPVGLITPFNFPIEIAAIGLVKDENYVNGLEAYGWGLGCRTLLDPSKQNNLGSIPLFSAAL